MNTTGSLPLPGDEGRRGHRARARSSGWSATPRRRRCRSSGSSTSSRATSPRPSIILSIVGFVIWYDFGPAPAFTYAMIVAVTTLIIACPCALGMATPMSLTTGVGLGASHGILIRSGDALQAAKKIDTIVLDKTGTITLGKPAVTDIVPADGFEIDAVLSLAAAAERDSEHPLAAAIVDGAAERGLDALIGRRGFEAIPGHGIRAWLGERRVLVGKRAFLEAAGVEAGALEADGEPARRRRQDARLRRPRRSGRRRHRDRRSRSSPTP